ncbi:MAG: hypothetical protein AB4040_18755 [Synechococcus sp.]
MNQHPLLSPPDRLSLYPYDGLCDLVLQFGGDRESLPQDCLPFDISELLETLVPNQPSPSVTSTQTRGLP